jgi:undecaprenyl-diphosphatase
VKNTEHKRILCNELKPVKHRTYKIMLETLNTLDTQLFLWLNSLHNEVLDPVMIFFTEKYTWLPLYAFLVGFIIYTFKKKAVGILLGVVLLVVLADQTTSRFFKPTFKRLRPCHNTEINAQIHKPNGCGGQYGFVSSHAANSMAVAMFLSFVFAENWLTILVFGWSVAVSYSRIYLAAHYPADIIIGGLIGLMYGYVIYKLLIILQTKLKNQQYI